MSQRVTTVASLIQEAQQRGFDTSRWKRLATPSQTLVAVSSLALPVVATRVGTMLPVLASKPWSALPQNMTEAQAEDELGCRVIYVAKMGNEATYAIIGGTGEPLRAISDRELSGLLSDTYVNVQRDDLSKSIPAYQWLTRSGRRRIYDRVIYDPEGKINVAGERVINTWTGFAFQPRRGNWGRMRLHLWVIICRRDRAVFRFVICWLAHAVQHPGTSPGSVIILASQFEGTGKTMVVNWMQAMFGRHGLVLESAELLLATFNAHLVDKSFIGVNEPSFAGDHRQQKLLKARVSDPQMTIEGKYQKAYQVENIAHMMFTTNEPRPVAAGAAARRFCLPDVDNCQAGRAAYFDPIHRQANSGGREAMLGFLLAVDLTGFDPSKPPVTDALRTQQELSASIEDRWALDVVEEPEALGVTLAQFNATADLYRSLCDYALLHHARVPSMKSFGQWLAGLGLQSGFGLAAPARRARGWHLPDAATFEAAIRTTAGFR